MAKKILCSIIALVLIMGCFNFSVFAEDVTYSVTIIDANEESYGNATSESVLTGLSAGSTVELEAHPNASAYVRLREWVVYKGTSTSKAQEGVDYTITIDQEDPNKAVLTVLGTYDLSVMPVFAGDIVNLNKDYEPQAAISPSGMSGLFVIVNSDGNVVSVPSITGWNNDPNEDLVATFSEYKYVFDPSQYAYKLGVWVRWNGMPNAFIAQTMLADGAEFDFSDLTLVNSNAGAKTYTFADGFEWIEYSFTIKDAQGNTLKNCKLIFKYPGLATIDAEHGGVKYNGTTYEDGDKVNLGLSEVTIEAIPDEGYAFDSWEITGVELDDPEENPLTFTMPASSDVVIKANFVAIASTDITVILPSNSYPVEYTVSGNVITVTNNEPCKVGYIGDDGKYVAVNAVPVDGMQNTYSFTVDDPAVTEVMLAVKGDSNANGRFDGGDITKAKAVSLGKTTLSPGALFAADANGNGAFDGGDITRMKAVSLGKTSFGW